MESHFVFLFLVGLACASTNPAWKENTEYVYLVNGRTLTSLHELSEQYSGVFLRAKIYITPYSQEKLYARITDAQYAPMNSRLPDGWNSNVPESELNYNKLNLSNNPFYIIVNDSLIKSLVVEKDIANWEANVIKSIVSQFQLDIQGENIIESPSNILPKNNMLGGVFKTMEETVTGNTETAYEIHHLPEYLSQSYSWLVPQPQLKGEDPVTEIIKHKDYTKSTDRPFYHYGFGELTQGKSTYNKVGDFLMRQSYSRLIVTGNLSNFTIQNAFTFNKIIINPTLTAKEKGSVISLLNVTLNEIKTRSELPQELINPMEIGNLVYSYESPFSESNEVRQKREEQYSTEKSNEGSWQSIHDFTDQQEEPRKYVGQFQISPSMSEAPQFPLLPYYTGYYGRSIKNNSTFDIKQDVIRIAKEISKDVPDPEKILIRSTLSKYILLCSLIRLMDEAEITSVTQQLYTDSKNGQEFLAWNIFRDAVAEAGTGPAFLNIQQWIKAQQIEKNEASEVVASMAYSVRVPTEEYIRKFFELIRSPEVRYQENLNETALLSFTRLINRVYVNRNESFNQYPIYSFGPLNTKKGRDFVKLKIIPYLSEQLHDAVSQAESRKIHVCIRALGNMGHKKILEVFKPYLEGKKQASQFQRMLMVLSMDKLVTSEPLVTRSVLYRIYRNPAEIPEVRVVAVHQLMRTVPPVEMIQRMAENTNTDPQDQVNAVVKSVIQSASQLKSPTSQILRKSAESALPFLTKKEFGKDQSLNLLQDFIVENMNIEFKHNFLQVGSVDHSFPKGMKYSVRGNISGMKHYFFNVQAMMSSIKKLINSLYQQTENYHQYQEKIQWQSEKHQFSSAKIAEYLNLRSNEREQLEGFIYSEIESLQRIWSFDKETIKQLPQVISEAEQRLMNGTEFNYIKLKQLKEMALSFPTEMGFPFLFTYDLPLLIQFEGNIKARANPEISRNNKLNVPKNIFGEIKSFVTTSIKVQSHLSIVTPFDHQIYTAGVNKNTQVHVPIIGKVNIDLNDTSPNVKVEVKVQETHKNARLFHYSSWPYTSKNDIMNLNPVALSRNTRRMRPENNTQRYFDFNFGQKQTGINFRVWGHHPRQSTDLFKFANLIRSEGIATAWQQIWDESSLQQTDVTIAFIPEQSRTDRIIINFRYEKQYQSQPDQKTKGFWKSAKDTFLRLTYQEPVEDQVEFLTMDEISAEAQYDSKKRQEDIIKYVGSEINNAQLYFLDASIKFEGGKVNIAHLLTLAVAKSNISPQSRFITFYKSNTESPTFIALQVGASVPNNNELDLNYSLNKTLKSKYEVLLLYGEKQPSTVKATVNLNRSNAREQYLKNNSLYKICMKQMEEGNRQLAACQNMIVESTYLDDIKIELQYENIRKEHANYVNNVFQGVRLWYYPVTDIKSIQSESKNKINIGVQFEPTHFRQVNVTIKAYEEETQIYDFPISELFAKTIFVSSPLSHLQARIFGQAFTTNNVKPTCVLDHKSAQTFSNWTYLLSLNKEWTLLMMYIPQEVPPKGQIHQQTVQQLESQPENIAVLARELSVGQREVKITFSNKYSAGKTVELTMKSNKPGAKPAASVQMGDKEVTFDDKLGAGLYNGYVEIYALPNGEVKLEIQDWLYIVFDSNRVKLIATSDKLLDSTVGLCGRFSEDKYEDFWTPDNCILNSSESFVRSFNIEAKQLEESQESYPECVSKVLPLYTEVISDRDFEKKGYIEDERFTGIRLRTHFIEAKGETCFTIHPVPVCKGLPRTSIMKEVPVHCVSNSETASYFRKEIDQGRNPDFSQKSQTKTVPVEIAQTCY